MRRLVASAALFGAVALSSMAHAQTTGATLFAQNCSACHQLTGLGIHGAFPALAGDPFVIGDPTRPAYVLLNGRGGMPNFSEDLSDADIAAVLSYVRSSWGNHAPPLDASLVAAVRGGGAAPPKERSVLPGH
jgi:mono/diheme cytochrome c family protein